MSTPAQRIARAVGMRGAFIDDQLARPVRVVIAEVHSAGADLPLQLLDPRGKGAVGDEERDQADEEKAADKLNHRRCLAAAFRPVIGKRATAHLRKA